MIAPDTARAAAEGLWQAMVELAEAGNDQVIAAQAGGSTLDAHTIAAIATDLAAVATAASILARHSQEPAP